MGKNYSFTVAVFLYCDSVSDCFYEEESEISDCIMKQAGTWMGSGLFLFRAGYWQRFGVNSNTLFVYNCEL